MLKFAFLSKIIRDSLDTTTKALYICIIRKQQNNQTMKKMNFKKEQIKKEIEKLAKSENATFLQAASAMQTAASKMGNQNIITIIVELKMEWFEMKRHYNN